MLFVCFLLLISFLLIVCMFSFHLLSSLSITLLLSYPPILFILKGFLFSFCSLILAYMLCILCILFLLCPCELLILVIDPFYLISHGEHLMIDDKHLEERWILKNNLLSVHLEVLSIFPRLISILLTISNQDFHFKFTCKLQLNKEYKVELV